MSQATLEFHPLPEVSPLARMIVLDCEHGTTRVAIGEHAHGPHIDDADAVCMALARHHAEEGCRCTRRLWQQYFGAPLGQIILAQGATP
jgi:hypothetical protein